MNELEKVNPEKVTLMIHGKEREIKFGFSTWAKLENEYGGLKNLEKMQKETDEKPFNVIPHLLYVGLVDKTPYVNEDGKKVEITEKNILDDYGLNDIQYISEVFNRAIYGSLPQESKKEVEATK